VRKKIITLLIGSLIFVSCKKEKTTWNSDWVLPIVNDTLSLENYVNDSTLEINSGNYYQFDLTRTIFDFGIEDFIGIPDTLIIHTFNSAVASINVPPGFSIVNEIEEHTMEVDDVQLKKIRVSQGTIKMKVYNPVNTSTYFTIKLPGVTKNGVLFEEQYVAPAGTSAVPGTVSAILDISGYDIDLTGISGGEFNILQSLLIVNTDPTGPSITLTNSQTFKVEAEFKDIRIDYARGYFGNISISDTSTFNVELLNNIIAGSIDLPASQIQFEIINGLKVDAKATITKVSNTNYSNNTVNLVSPEIGSPIYIDGATGTWSSLINTIETVEFNELNSNMETYLENLGKSQTVGYKIELNPWGNTSGGWNEIFPNSRLTVKLKAQMPLAVGADGLTLRDTFNFDISQDKDKSRIESGEITLNASNAFPLSSEVKLDLMTEDGTILYTIFGTSSIKSALYGVMDPISGLMKMDSEVKFLLTDAIISDLDLIKKVAVETVFNTPNPSTSLNEQMTIPAGAFLAVKLKAQLNIKAVY